jgi:hypothetical protein
LSDNDKIEAPGQVGPAVDPKSSQEKHSERRTLFPNPGHAPDSGLEPTATYNARQRRNLTTGVSESANSAPARPFRQEIPTREPGAIDSMSSGPETATQAPVEKIGEGHGATSRQLGMAGNEHHSSRPPMEYAMPDSYGNLGWCETGRASNDKIRYICRSGEPQCPSAIQRCPRGL